MSGIGEEQNKLTNHYSIRIKLSKNMSEIWNGMNKMRQIYTLFRAIFMRVLLKKIIYFLWSM